MTLRKKIGYGTSFNYPALSSLKLKPFGTIVSMYTCFFWSISNYYFYNKDGKYSGFMPDSCSPLLNLGAPYSGMPATDMIGQTRSMRGAPDCGGLCEWVGVRVVVGVFMMKIQMCLCHILFSLFFLSLSFFSLNSPSWASLSSRRWEVGSSNEICGCVSKHTIVSLLILEIIAVESNSLPCIYFGGTISVYEG